jgi:hypothetical protein
MDDLLVCATDFRNRAVAKFGRNSVQGLDLGLSLDLVEWVSVRRVADSKSIDGECAVPRGERGVHVAVVVVVVGEIPVSVYSISGARIKIQSNLRLIETNTVSQNLDSSAAAVVRSAILGRDVIAALKSLVSLE